MKLSDAERYEKLLEGQAKHYKSGAAKARAKRRKKIKKGATRATRNQPPPRLKMTPEEKLANQVERLFPGINRGASRLGDARKFPRLGSGVFFLIRAHEVVYIGSGMEVSKRVLEIAGDKDFDEVQYYPEPRGLMRDIETAYIRVLRPKYNRRSLTEPEATARDLGFTSRRVTRIIPG